MPIGKPDTVLEITPCESVMLCPLIAFYNILQFQGVTALEFCNEVTVQIAGKYITLSKKQGTLAKVHPSMGKKQEIERL